MTVAEEQPQNAENVRQGNTRHAKRHRTLAHKWRLVSLPNKLIVIATVIIAISNGIYTFVALRTLREIRASSSDTHDLAVAAGNEAISSGKQAEAAKAQSEQAKAQTDKMAESLTKTDDLIRQATEQTKASNRVAKASEDAASLGRNNLELSRDSLHVQQRPWVGVDFVSGTFEDGIIKATAKFKNYGKSPAFRLTYHSVFDIKQPSILLKYNFTDARRTERGERG
jgi:hypothetical protein